MSLRLKLFLFSFFYTLISIYILNSLNINKGFVFWGVVIFLILVFYFINYWLFNFNLYPIGFYTIIFLPSAYYGGFLMFYSIFLSNLNLFYQFIFVLVFIFSLYYLLLNQNILNSALFDVVSLYMAALNINSFYTVLTFFLYSVSILLLQGYFFYKLVFILFVFILLYTKFVILNRINSSIFWLSVVTFFYIIVLIFFLFLSGMIQNNIELLIAGVITFVFRGIVFASLHLISSKISFLDYFLAVLESISIIFIFYIMLISN